MPIIILLLLAVIQGVTEFLPVSSSGHLVLLYNIFGIENNVQLLSILLHVATLMSVLVYYRKEIVILIKNPLCSTNKKLVVTTITTCGVVLILKPFIDKTFNGDWLFVFFIITAILLFVSDYLSERSSLMTRIYGNCDGVVSKNSNTQITNIPITYKQAVIIGLTQGVACIPGISRSGSTIAVGRMIGAKDTTRYSFLISIPIIIASFVMEIFDGGIGNLAGINIIALILAMVVCFVVGLLCIKLVNKIAEKNRLTLFAYYLIGLSVLLIVLSITGVM